MGCGATIFIRISFIAGISESWHIVAFVQKKKCMWISSFFIMFMTSLLGSCWLSWSFHGECVLTNSSSWYLYWCNFPEDSSGGDGWNSQDITMLVQNTLMTLLLVGILHSSFSGPRDQKQVSSFYPCFQKLVILAGS